MPSYFQTVIFSCHFWSFCAAKKLFIISFSSTYQFVHFCICIMFAPIGTCVFYDISISMVQNFLMIAFFMLMRFGSRQTMAFLSHVMLLSTHPFLAPIFCPQHAYGQQAMRYFPIAFQSPPCGPFFSNDISHTFYDQLAFSFPHRISISTQHPFLHLLKFHTPHSNIYAP